MTEEYIMVVGELLNVLNKVLENKGQSPLEKLRPEMRLREDVGFKSLDLAELTVRIEEKFDIDVFAGGLVFTVGEIAERLRRG